MQKQNLLIHNSTILYDILFEIKHLVSFNIKEISNLEIEEQSFHALDLIISVKSCCLIKLRISFTVSGSLNSFCSSFKILRL